MTKIRYAIALDFDGVIHEYDNGYQDGTLYGDPKTGAFDAIMALLDRFNVFIHSTRNPELIAEWLLKHDAPFDFAIIEETEELRAHPFYDRPGVVGITQVKLAALRYVDDRAHYFNPDKRAVDEWTRTLDTLLKVG